MRISHYSIAKATSLLSLAALAWIPSCSEAGAVERGLQAELRCKGPLEVDTSDHLLGETIHHAFELENVCPTPLTVDRVTSSCGCSVQTMSVVAGATTTSYHEKEPIPPGATLLLECSVNTTAKRAGPGEAKYDVLFSSAADDQQHLGLVLKFKLMTPITLSPESIDLGNLELGHSKEATVVATSEIIPAFSLSAGSGGDPDVEATCIPRGERITSADGVSLASEWEIHVRVTTTVRGDQERNYMVGLQMKGQDETTARNVPLFVRARVVEGVYAESPALRLGTINPGTTATARFSIHCPQDCEAKSAGVVVADVFDETWLATNLSVTIDGRTDPAVITGQVALQVSDCPASSIRCRVLVPVRSRNQQETRVPLIVYGRIDKAGGSAADDEGK